MAQVIDFEQQKKDFLKEHTAVCPKCQREFIMWQINWDGAYEEPDLCKSCAEKRRKRYESTKKYQRAVERFKLECKQEAALTEKTKNDKINPSMIDDFVRALKKFFREYDFKGGLTIEWPEDQFELMKLFVRRNGFEAHSRAKRFRYLGVTHKLFVACEGGVRRQRE